MGVNLPLKGEPCPKCSRPINNFKLNKKASNVYVYAVHNIPTEKDGKVKNVKKYCYLSPLNEYLYVNKSVPPYVLPYKIYIGKVKDLIIKFLMDMKARYEKEVDIIKKKDISAEEMKKELNDAMKTLKSSEIEIIKVCLQNLELSEKEYIEEMPHIIYTIWQGIIKRTNRLLEQAQSEEEKVKIHAKYQSLQKELLTYIKKTMPNRV